MEGYNSPIGLNNRINTIVLKLSKKKISPIFFIANLQEKDTLYFDL